MVAVLLIKIKSLMNTNTAKGNAFELKCKAQIVIEVRKHVEIVLENNQIKGQIGSADHIA